MVQLAAAMLTRLPEGVANACGSTMGWIAGSLLRIRRRTVDENLARAFPDRSPRWRTGVAARTYRHFGREAVSLFRFQRMQPSEIQGRTEVAGLDLLEGPVASGQGVIALVGHFGNWEIAGAGATARGVPVYAVARRQKNSLFDGYMEDVRAHLGMGVVYRKEATRTILKRMRTAPQVVAIVADQNVARGGVFVDFFGLSAATARGPGVLALRTGAPVVFVDSRRLPGSPARYRVRFEPVRYEVSGDAEDDVRQLTSAYMKRLEAAVREAPDQYFWFHKRWKTRPETLGQEPEAGPPVPGVSRLGEAAPGRAAHGRDEATGRGEAMEEERRE